MKKFLIKLSIFLAVIIVFDFIAGGCFGILRKNAKSGSTQQNNYIAEECVADIVILGSSRAQYHYVPSVFSKQLGLTCYNCGKDGNGLILAYTRLNMIEERCTPKIVIYDVNPKFDYLTGQSYSVCYPHIKPYYNHKTVKEIISTFSDLDERLMMNSNLYRNNSRILPDIASVFVKQYSTENGFLPQYGEMNKPVSDTDDYNNVYEVDYKKMDLMEKMIKECREKNIMLIFAVSPCFSGHSTESFEPIKQLSLKYDIPFLDYYYLENLSGTLKYFCDKTHMNVNGAMIYSQKIVDDIKELNPTVTEKL